MMRRLVDWLMFRLFSRWFKVTITDPEEIAKIKEEFGIDLPNNEHAPGTWVQPRGKP